MQITVGSLAEGFYVEDDSPGISAEESEKVFEDGYSTSHHGTGFWLTIISRIAEPHGWDIDIVEGTEDGARFEFTGVEGVVEETSDQP